MFIIIYCSLSFHGAKATVSIRVSCSQMVHFLSLFIILVNEDIKCLRIFGTKEELSSNEYFVMFFKNFLCFLSHFKR